MLNWLSAVLKAGKVTALWSFNHTVCPALKNNQTSLKKSCCHRGLLLGPASGHTIVFFWFYICMPYYFRYPAFTIKHFINIPEEESEASNHAKFLVKTGLWSLVHRPNGCLIGSIHLTRFLINQSQT